MSGNTTVSTLDATHNTLTVFHLPLGHKLQDYAQ